MTPAALSRRTILFVNVAHALDHFVLLIYPTAVIAMAPELGLSDASLIGLSTGTFVAFGLFSLPMGWLAERWGRRNMLAAFFGACGLSLLGLAACSAPAILAAWLLVLGVFSAIYHPIGSAMLVSHARQLGRDLVHGAGEEPPVERRGAQKSFCESAGRALASSSLRARRPRSERSTRPDSACSARSSASSSA